MIKFIKNKMINYIIALSMMVLLCASCNSVGIESLSNELSEREQCALIERARKFVITTNHLNITPDDKRFVKNELPRLFIDYTGYKRGIAKMVWRINPSYSIRIICKEDLTDKSGLIRLTVSRFK
jgi:hypothetical protein